MVAVARRVELMEAMADEVEALQHPRPILVKQDVMQEDAAARISDAALSALGRISTSWSTTPAAAASCRLMRPRTAGPRR